MIFHFCKLLDRFLLVRIKGWIFKIASSLASCCVQVKKEHKSHLNNERLRTTMVVTSTWLSSSELFCWRFVVPFPLGKCIFKKYLQSQREVFFKSTSSDSLRKHTKSMGYRKRCTKDTKTDTTYLQPVDVGSSGIIPVLHGLRTMVVVTSTWQEWDFLLRICN